MKTEPNHQQPIDSILEDELKASRSASFQRTLRAAQLRRRTRQAMVYGAPLLLMLAIFIFQEGKGMVKKSTTNIVMHSQSKGSLMGKTKPNASTQASSFNIPRLTDAEFEKIMKGYPMAIIRKGNETHYVPLDH